MDLVKRLAQRAVISGNIFGSCAEIKAKYVFGPQNGNCTELILPYLPDGIISDLSVSCDGKQFSGSKAVNIREISGLPKKNFVSVTERTAGLLTLRLSDVFAKECMEIVITVFMRLNSQKNHTSLILPQIGGGCPININIKIHGAVKKVISSTHSITTAVSDNLCDVLSDGKSDRGSFILDIFYSDSLANSILISRQPFRKNIALCSFAPKLKRLRNSQQIFDIHISFDYAKRSEIISAAAAFLRCLKDEQLFRLTVCGERLTDFLPGKSKNIDMAINMICENDNTGALNPEEGDWNTVIICSIAVFDTETKLCGIPLILLSDNGNPCPAAQDRGGCIIVSEENAEILVPSEFSRLYEKRLAPARLTPIGGIGVELLPERFESLTANSISFCFAKHDILPPKGVVIRKDNKRPVEEIEFDAVYTYYKLRAIDAMYAVELVNQLEREAESAKPEEYCIYRQKINEICLSENIAAGDIALISTANGSMGGFISGKPVPAKRYGKYFREETIADPKEVIKLILKSQTSDGIIADITVSRPDQTAFSTAVCLIALYLYTKSTYAAFAARSLDYLRRSSGFWAKTAVALWNGDAIDFDILGQRLEMKIMYEQLHELAVLIIQNYRRKIK